MGSKNLLIMKRQITFFEDSPGIVQVVVSNLADGRNKSVFKVPLNCVSDVVKYNLDC